MFCSVKCCYCIVVLVLLCCAGCLQSQCPAVSASRAGGWVASVTGEWRVETGVSSELVL